MKLFIGADHRGFQLKEALKPWVSGLGHEVIDCGNTKLEPEDDFPDFAFAVADAVADAIAKDPESRGIVICGSGGGVTIAANKVRGIRCVLGMNVEDVEHNRDHNDANVLALAADSTPENKMKEMISTFLTTKFSGANKCKRRIGKIMAREEDNCGGCGCC